MISSMMICLVVTGAIALAVLFLIGIYAFGITIHVQSFVDDFKERVNEGFRELLRF